MVEFASSIRRLFYFCILSFHTKLPDMSKIPVPIKDLFLADDNREDCLSFERAVLHINPHIKLTTVNNGEELLQLLNHYIPQLLFLDLEMPFKNGIQCLQIIRENKMFDSLPIVVFSSTSRINNIQVAYGFGANLFFTKPGDFTELVSSLNIILQLDWTDPGTITQQFFRNNQYQPFQL